MEYAELNDIIKEFLKYNGYKSTLDCFDEEEKAKLATNKLSKKNLGPTHKVTIASHSHTLGG